MSEQQDDATRDEPVVEQSGEVEGQATTTFTKDYMGRDLVTPSINSRDFLGRGTWSAVDYMARELQP